MSCNYQATFMPYLQLTSRILPNDILHVRQKALGNFNLSPRGFVNFLDGDGYEVALQFDQCDLDRLDRLHVLRQDGRSHRDLESSRPDDACTLVARVLFFYNLVNICFPGAQVDTPRC